MPQPQWQIPGIVEPVQRCPELEVKENSNRRATGEVRKGRGRDLLIQEQLARSHSVLDVGRHIPGSVFKEEMYVIVVNSLGTYRDFVKLLH